MRVLPSFVRAVMVTYVGLAVALLASPASAHTELVGGTPGPGTALRTPVTQVTLTFASDLLAEGSQVLVRDPKGVDRARGLDVSGASATVPVKPLRVAGRYTVAYRAVAVDGHPITGSYRFTVSRSAASAAADLADVGTASAGGPTDDSSRTASDAPRTAVSAPSTPTWVIGLLGAATLAALLWIGAGRRSLRDETKRR
jgi:methionine-rich copper-binding protein CopC